MGSLLCKERDPNFPVLGAALESQMLRRQPRDRLDLAAIVIDRGRCCRRARDSLERKNPAACEEIEKVHPGDSIAEDVEECLARALGSRTEIAGWNGNTAAAMRAGGHTECRHYCCAAPVVPMK